MDEVTVLRAVAASAPGVVVVADRGDVVRWVSPSAHRHLQVDPQEAVGRLVSALTGAGAVGVRAAHVRTVLAGQESARYADTCRRADGEVVEVDAVVVPVRDDHGRVRGTATSFTEATADLEAHRRLQAALVRARAALRRAYRSPAGAAADESTTIMDLRFSEALHRAVVENVEEGIAATAPDGSTILANDRLAELLGLEPAELRRRDLAGLLLPADDGWGARGARPARREVVRMLPSGESRVLAVTASPLRAGVPEEPADLGVLYVVTDVTDARRAEAELRHQALHDPLTGLPNRYLLVDRIAMAEARARRSEVPGTAMLFVDLDDFKSVNDVFGHACGDEVLVEVAHRLRASVRGSDTVARLGGDEFAILCEETGELGAQLVAERVHDALRVPVTTSGGVRHEVRVSIGVAVSPPVATADLVKVADSAMYDAKHSGGARTALSPMLG